MKLATYSHSEQELLNKARWLAGFTLGDIAQMLNIAVPPDLKRDKGWVGMLIETALGAKAGSKAEQDFAHLGIELKTIPINRFGLPLETTFVALAPLTNNQGVTWENSHFWQKLQKVLWVPILAERTIPLAQRYIGQPVLWSPNEKEQQQLRADWEELMELIIMGRFSEINATLGEVVQLRPKGRNRQDLANAVDRNGKPIQTLPLGFYLRKSFTAKILQQFLNEAF